MAVVHVAFAFHPLATTETLVLPTPVRFDGIFLQMWSFSPRTTRESRSHFSFMRVTLARRYSGGL